MAQNESPPFSPPLKLFHARRLSLGPKRYLTNSAYGPNDCESNDKRASAEQYADVTPVCPLGREQRASLQSHAISEQNMGCLCG